MQEIRESILPVDLGEVPKWDAEFTIDLANSDFKPIRTIAFNGHFTGEGQRYFWGFGPKQNHEGWVFRVDLDHFDFKPGVDYLVGSGGFRALLVEGGSLVVSGGIIKEGLMRINKIDPDNGRIEGKFFNVKATAGRSDGTEMDPAYATEISFKSNWEKK